jgi:hypothetical protein
MVRCKRHELDAPAIKEAVRADTQSIGTIAHDTGEGGLDLAAGAGFENFNLSSDRTRRFR